MQNVLTSVSVLYVPPKSPSKLIPKTPIMQQSMGHLETLSRGGMKRQARKRIA
jgi:hypothetical protein